MQGALKKQYDSVDALLESGAITDMQDDVSCWFFFQIIQRECLYSIYVDWLVCSNGSCVQSFRSYRTKNH